MVSEAALVMCDKLDEKCTRAVLKFLRTARVGEVKEGALNRGGIECIVSSFFVSVLLVLGCGGGLVDAPWPVGRRQDFHSLSFPFPPYHKPRTREQCVIIADYKQTKNRHYG